MFFQGVGVGSQIIQPTPDSHYVIHNMYYVRLLSQFFFNFQKNKNSFLKKIDSNNFFMKGGSLEKKVNFVSFKILRSMKLVNGGFPLKILTTS